MEAKWKNEPTNGNMKTSDSQKTYIKGKEGCKLISYMDLNGKFWDIGYGHEITEADGIPMQAGSTIPQAQADALFDQDIVGFENIANKLLTGTVSQSCFDAVIDMLYDGIPTDSHVFVLINQGDFPGASEWIKGHYIEANGVEEPGLVARRADDSQLIAA